MIKAFYREEISRRDKERKILNRQIIWTSLGRLICFAIFITGIFLWVQEGTWWLVLITFAFLALFLYLVRLSADLSEERNFISNLVKIYENELKMIRERTGFFGTGEEFSGTSPFTADMDLFGKFSLFHLLNRTTSFHSAGYLASNIIHPLTSKEEIVKRQKAVAVLAPQAIPCNELTAKGLLNATPGSMKAFETWLQLPSKTLHQLWMKWLLRGFPVFSVASFLYYLSTGNYLFLLSAVLIGWVILSFFMKYINHQHGLLVFRLEDLKQYAGILKQFSIIDAGDSEILIRLKKDAAEAATAVRKLASLASTAEQRNNLLVNIFLNSTLLYDLQMVHALEKWKRDHGEKFVHWKELIAEIEFYISLAAFSRNHPQYVFPEILEGNPKVVAEKMGHPLIPEPEIVTNDVYFEDEKIRIVTGSNMSGKTTFLRTVGVNIILSGIGAPVFAEKMRITPLRLLTSVSISDSLQEHTSYFMAELKKLRMIIDGLEKGTPAMVMVDEILRGTNSEDKTYGSAGFIRKILQYNCLGIIATHDLALCKLEDEMPGIVKNYCFESFIREGELVFDYTLREGIATNKNASFLMNKMGVISESSRDFL